jgi:hypothetical protein
VGRPCYLGIASFPYLFGCVTSSSWWGMSLRSEALVLLNVVVVWGRGGFIQSG